MRAGRHREMVPSDNVASGAIEMLNGLDEWVVASDAVSPIGAA